MTPFPRLLRILFFLMEIPPIRTLLRGEEV